MEEDTKNGNSQQALEPVLQEDVPFKEHTITAVRLTDGRIAVVLRWVCEVLNLDPSGQVQRIQRTAAIANELLRVKVQPREKPKRGGGAQLMPVLTLRGFPTWILGINPNEVEEDPNEPGKAEKIRRMIVVYQVEAVDTLYNHFAQGMTQHAPALPEGSRAAVVVRERTTEFEPTKPAEPSAEATEEELATYYEDLALWALSQARQHAQRWRGRIEEWR